MLSHLCPRCGTNTVNVCHPPRRVVPFVATFWCSLFVGAVLVGMGDAQTAAVVAVVLNIGGITATVTHTMQLWYRCNRCATMWYRYPWQRSRHA